MVRLHITGGGGASLGVGAHHVAVTFHDFETFRERNSINQSAEGWSTSGSELSFAGVLEATTACCSTDTAGTAAGHRSTESDVI